MKKERIDLLMVARKLVDSRSKAQALIMAGEVMVGQQRIVKASETYLPDCDINLKERCPYVSRGAYKLLSAIEHFNLELTGFTCVDIGSSTGGFTDLMLQHGAKRVYAIDVGTNQLDYKIRKDPRVIVFEKTNARHFDYTTLDPINLFTIDVSFISLKRIIPGFADMMAPGAICVALIKPQFEVGKSVADRFRGVIKDKEIQKDVVSEIESFIIDSGLIVEGITPSKIQGMKGNQEYLILFKK